MDKKTRLRCIGAGYRNAIVVSSRQDCFAKDTIRTIEVKNPLPKVNFINVNNTGWKSKSDIQKIDLDISNPIFPIKLQGKGFVFADDKQLSYITYELPCHSNPILDTNYFYYLDNIEGTELTSFINDSQLRRRFNQSGERECELIMTLVHHFTNSSSLED